MAVGVVIVTFNARDVIVDCLESLLTSRGADLRVVVVDNASRDGTIEAIRAWSRGAPWRPPVELPFAPVPHGPVPLREGGPARRLGEIGLVAAPENLGFAGGVNLGLRTLLAEPEVEHVWILNPDCMAENGTARALLDCAARAGRYGLIGGRIFYASPRDMIQSDGGRIDLWTGTCTPFNMTRQGRDVPAPPPGALHYVPGTHMFASRAFLERAGPMPEDYFLYYEEMEWCLRRGDLPLVSCPEAAVHHHGGHSIGSATVNQGPSPMSVYFMGRARMRFVARHRPVAAPVAFAYAAAKAARYALRREPARARALLRGILGLPPSRATLEAIGRARLPRPVRGAVPARWPRSDPSHGGATR